MSSSDTTNTDSGGYSLFDHKITNDWTICRNCFARTHILHEEYDPSDLPKSLRGVVTADVERTTSAMTDYPPGYQASKQRTICGECGSDRRTILKRPVKKSTARTYAQHLTERVEEHPELSMGDSDALVDEIEHRKVECFHNKRNNALYQHSFDDVVELTDE